MTKKSSMEINKGNYQFDTKERLELYEKYRGLGWEEEYKSYRKAWSDYPRSQIVSEYPLNLDIEMAAVCNLKCPMCFLQSDNIHAVKSQPYMDFDLFKKIVDEIAPDKVPAIRLNFRGEPTLNPKFVEMVKYAKEKGIKEISMTSNGSKLTPDFFRKIMDYMDWISISVDGLKENYEKIRKPIKFEEILQNIKDIKRIKEESGKKRPVIYVKTIWTAIKDYPQEYYNAFEPYADLVGYAPTGNYDEVVNESLLMEDFICPVLYQRLMILTDGTALLCCGDYDSTIKIEKITKLRKIHEEGRYKDIPLCRQCGVPRIHVDSHEIEINDRKIMIRDLKKSL